MHQTDQTGEKGMSVGTEEENSRTAGGSGAAFRALRACFPSTVPVLFGYVFLGITYGILMTTNGFPFWLPVLTAFLIYTGSMEFLCVEILTSSFNPLSAFATAVMVGARHLFYGLSLLEKYKGTGWKKPYLIYSTSDETFAINYAAQIPKGVDRSWYYLWVSFLDQMYWVAGSALGGLFGSLITVNTKGLDFVMTTMFTVIFLNQWMKDSADAKNAAARKEGDGNSPRKGSLKGGFFSVHISECVGVVSAVICLLIFGADHFIIPTMFLMLLLLTVLRRPIERSLPPEEKTADSGRETGNETVHTSESETISTSRQEGGRR